MILAVKNPDVNRKERKRKMKSRMVCWERRHLNVHTAKQQYEHSQRLKTQTRDTVNFSWKVLERIDIGQRLKD